MTLAQAAAKFRDAFTPDPGTSDLYDEQPLTITVSLGDWRRLDYALSSNLQAGGKSRSDYAKRNPLGGPAKVFEAMAARIRSGEEFYSVLDDYGFAVKPSTTMPDMSTPDKWERLRAGIAHKQQSGPNCPAKDPSQDFPCQCGARFIDECADSHSVNAMKGGDGG